MLMGRAYPSGSSQNSGSPMKGKNKTVWHGAMAKKIKKISAKIIQLIQRALLSKNSAIVLVPPSILLVTKVAKRTATTKAQCLKNTIRAVRALH